MDYYDLLLAKKLADGGGSSIVVEELSVTENGTYNAETGKAYNPVNVNVPTTGGSLEPKDANFYDYDGTLLYSYTTEEFSELTSLPENPSHTGLTSQGWNWSLNDIQTQLNFGAKTNVGQEYITDDGKTRIYVHFDNACKAPYLGIYPNGTVVVDWGDGSSTDTLSGSSYDTKKTVQHTYSSSGDYMITLNATSGKYAIKGTSGGSNLLTFDGYNVSSNNYFYDLKISKIELGSNVVIGDYSFSHCHNLCSITIPYETRCQTVKLSYSFQYCQSLKFLSLPEAFSTSSNIVTTVESFFSNCCNLEHYSLPVGITKIDYFAGSCTGLKDFVIPYTVTNLGNNSFSYCNMLENVFVPSFVTNNGYGTFTTCTGIKNAVVDNNASLGDDMFSYCNSLETITTPSDSGGYGNATFSGCSSLKNNTIRPKQGAIIDGCLRQCISLTNVTIPADVTGIGANAFTYCYGVTEYHLLPTSPPSIQSNSFAGIKPQCVIYVPSASLSAYQTATNWSAYASQMQGE